MKNNSPIRNLLVSMNQSSSGCLICFYYKFFDRAKEANMYEIKSWRVLNVHKSCYSWGKIWYIDIDDIGKLEDLLRLVFIDKECGNLLKLSLMVENLLGISSKRGSQTFYKPINVHAAKNAVGKRISSISNWNIVGQFGEHGFSCG